MNIDNNNNSFLSGQCIVSTPNMEDSRFEHAVIFVCAHSKDGAMGIMINRKIEQVTFSDLLEQLELFPSKDILINDVLYGGPVETIRGFVIHSSDYRQSGTLLLNDNIALTATIDILKELANGKGPKNALIALGYAGWAPEQLENELKQNSWISLPADPELLFNTPVDKKWETAYSKIGIDPSMLSSSGGNA
ncbi:MAG: YqgE/AlgH family protein [Alphaproteobacteria bacterium]